MKKKPSKKEKSILTLELEGETLIELNKVKKILDEKTSAGAIRQMIHIFPIKVEEIELLKNELESKIYILGEIVGALAHIESCKNAINKLIKKIQA